MQENRIFIQWKDGSSLTTVSRTFQADLDEMVRLKGAPALVEYRSANEGYMKYNWDIYWKDGWEHWDGPETWSLYKSMESLPDPSYFDTEGYEWRAVSHGEPLFNMDKEPDEIYGFFLNGFDPSVEK